MWRAFTGECVCAAGMWSVKDVCVHRKPGMVALINSISAQMDKGNYVFELSDYNQDIHTVASLLKKFLKELPDALIPHQMYQHFLDCSRIPDPEIQLSTLKELVYRLPTAHYHTLRFLMKHLAKIVEHSAQNKVSGCVERGLETCLSSVSIKLRLYKENSLSMHM